MPALRLACGPQGTLKAADLPHSRIELLGDCCCRPPALQLPPELVLMEEGRLSMDDMLACIHRHAEQDRELAVQLKQQEALPGKQPQRRPGAKQGPRLKRAAYHTLVKCPA